MDANFTGTWIANLSRSRLLGPPPRSISITIEHSNPQLKEEIVVTRLDGSENRLVFECWTNGEPDRSQLNGMKISGNARWEGEVLVIESWLQSGARQLHFCDCWALSPDGQTLSMEHRDDDLAGQLTILDKVG